MILFLILFNLSFAQTVQVDSAFTSTFAASGGVQPLSVWMKDSYSVAASVITTTPSSITFSCAVSDLCTTGTHGYKTGLKVQLTTTNTLPAGVTTSTDYWVIYVSDTTFKLASSLVNAQAGTAIDITDTGTGVHTINPVALAGASLKLQGSMDNTNWFDLPIKATGDATKSSNITASGTFYLNETDLNVNYIRVYYTLTAGQISVSHITKTE